MQPKLVDKKPASVVQLTKLRKQSATQRLPIGFDVPLSTANILLCISPHLVCEVLCGHVTVRITNTRKYIQNTLKSIYVYLLPHEQLCTAGSCGSGAKVAYSVPGAVAPFCFRRKVKMAVSQNFVVLKRSLGGQN